MLKVGKYLPLDRVRVKAPTSFGRAEVGIWVWGRGSEGVSFILTQTVVGQSQFEATSGGSKSKLP
jgi:hypothetical protein